MAKVKGDIVTAADWQDLSNRIYDLATLKKINAGAKQYFAADNGLSAAKVNAMQNAIKTIASVFNNNCCQSTCQSQCRCQMALMYDNCMSYRQESSICGCSSH